MDGLLNDIVSSAACPPRDLESWKLSEKILFARGILASLNISGRSGSTMTRSLTLESSDSKSSSSTKIGTSLDKISLRDNMDFCFCWYFKASSKEDPMVDRVLDLIRKFVTKFDEEEFKANIS
jgi:hypothetical protein